jgi:ParB-like chromosome segregation protein Spo0J
MPKKTSSKTTTPDLRLEITYQDPKRLKLWDENPRRNDAAAKKLVPLIEAHGFGQPVTVREEDGIVYKGNTRVKAALLMGMDAVPTMVRSYPEKQDAIDDAVADNKAAENSEWDEDKLVDALGERDKADIARRVGFEPAEIAALQEGWKGNDPEEKEACVPHEKPEVVCPKCGHTWKEA